MYWVRNPILPTGEVRASDPYAAVHEAAADRDGQAVLQELRHVKAVREARLVRV